MLVMATLIFYSLLFLLSCQLLNGIEQRAGHHAHAGVDRIDGAASEASGRNDRVVVGAEEVEAHVASGDGGRAAEDVRNKLLPIDPKLADLILDGVPILWLIFADGTLRPGINTIKLFLR